MAGEGRICMLISKCCCWEGGWPGVGGSSVAGMSVVGSLGEEKATEGLEL